VVAPTTINDAGSVKMMQNLPQQLFLNDAGSVKMMQNLPQQLFLNDAGSVKMMQNDVVFLPYE